MKTQIEQKLLKTVWVESDFILRVQTALWFVLSWNPLHYHDFFYFYPLSSAEKMAAEIILLCRLRLGKLCILLFLQKISFKFIRCTRFTYDYESLAIPFWKQFSSYSLYLHVVLLCSLRSFTEVDFFASAIQNAGDWLLKFSQVHQTKVCTLLVLI